MSESNFIKTGTLPVGQTEQGAGIPGNPLSEAPVPSLISNAYASLETARIYLNEWDDFALIAALQAASQIVRDYLGIEYLQQVTTEVYLRTQRHKKILLNRGPINSISQVEILSYNRQAVIATLSSASYYFDDKCLTVVGGGTSGTVIYNQNAPWHESDSLAVTYDAGYVTTPTPGYTLMPQAIQLGTIYTAKAILMARTADFNVSGENAAGAYSMQYLVNSVGNIPPTAQIMLQPYRRTAEY